MGVDGVVGANQPHAGPDMGRLGLAIRAFFKILGSRVTADAVRRALANEAESAAVLPRAGAESTTAEAASRESRPRDVPPAKPAATHGQEALALLSALQREARFVDFVQEPLTDYTDAQIGAAVRDVHRECAGALERWFALRPLVDEAEGASLEVPAGFQASRYRLTGNVSGQAPYRGRLCHHGWQATRCEIPSWTGTADAARVVAPAEVELA